MTIRSTPHPPTITGAHSRIQYLSFYPSSSPLPPPPPARCASPSLLDPIPNFQTSKIPISLIPHIPSLLRLHLYPPPPTSSLYSDHNSRIQEFRSDNAVAYFLTFPAAVKRVWVMGRMGELGDYCVGDLGWGDCLGLSGWDGGGVIVGRV